MDSSGPVCAVALMQDDVILYEARSCNGLTHSETLMPMVDQALSAANIPARELDLIACVAGPGSFTGVRIGVCAARAMAHAWQIPCAQLNALQVLAMAAYGFEGTICPILDARRGQVYGAAFRFDGSMMPERILPDVAISLEEYVDMLPKQGKLLFVGDGVGIHAPKVMQLLGERAQIAPPHIAQISAAAACTLAMLDEGCRMDHIQLAPIYLRAPQAERERAARLEAQHG